MLLTLVFCILSGIFGYCISFWAHGGSVTETKIEHKVEHVRSEVITDLTTKEDKKTQDNSVIVIKEITRPNHEIVKTTVTYNHINIVEHADIAELSDEHEDDHIETDTKTVTETAAPKNNSFAITIAKPVIDITGLKPFKRNLQIKLDASRKLGAGFTMLGFYTVHNDTLAAGLKFDF